MLVAVSQQPGHSAGRLPLSHGQGTHRVDLGAMICANRAGAQPVICRHPLPFEMLHLFDAVDRSGPVFAVSMILVRNTECRSRCLKRLSTGWGTAFKRPNAEAAPPVSRPSPQALGGNRMVGDEPGQTPWQEARSLPMAKVRRQQVHRRLAVCVCHPTSKATAPSRPPPTTSSSGWTGS